MAAGKRFFACFIVASFACLLLAGQASAAPPANNDFAGAQALSSTPTNLGGTNVEANKQSGEPNHAGDPGGASVWYSWTAPSTGSYQIDTCGSNFDTLLAVYTGSAVGSLTRVVSNDEAVNCPSASRVSFQASSGTTYRIAVDGYSVGGEEAADTGTFQLNLHSLTFATPPANDHFDINYGGFTGTDPVQGYNWDAGKDSGEPAHAGNSGGASVWYSWTAPDTGLAYVDTCYSEFDTLLAVYKGNSLNTLTPVASNNDGCGEAGAGSEVQFYVVRGTTYRIAVDGRAGPNGAAIGAFELSFYLTQPPQNDNFAAATLLSGASAYASGTNVDASAEPGEPAHGGFAPFMSVWYRWAAPFSGPVTIDTCASDFDTVLDVYTGNWIGVLAPVASNNNSSSCSPRSQVAFNASVGTTYWIAVDGVNDFGDIGLRLAETAPATLVDKVAPESVIKKLLVDSEHQKATLKFGSNESGGSFRCKLDNSGYKACHSPKAFRHLDAGKHKVKIKAVDAAGNVDTSPAVKKFKIEP